MIDVSACIDPDARVDDSCSVGARTRIWQFATVIRGAVLGADCNVASGATLDGAVFGDRCLVQANAVIGAGVHVGSEVFIGPNVTICNDMWPSVSKEGWDLEEVRSLRIVSIHDGASIGANAVILPGAVIGKGAMVAAGAICRELVPDGYLLTETGALHMMPKPRHRVRVIEAERDEVMA